MWIIIGFLLAIILFGVIYNLIGLNALLVKIFQMSYGKLIRFLLAGGSMLNAIITWIIFHNIFKSGATIASIIVFTQGVWFLLPCSILQRFAKVNLNHFLRL